jgi:hypothetical protein
MAPTLVAYAVFTPARLRLGWFDGIGASHKGNTMTVLMWLGIAAGTLLVLATGLHVGGARRWVEGVRIHTRLLDSGSVDTRERRPSPARFDARELDGLPAPVQRYFRAVLTDRQPIIASATLRMTGTLNLSATTDQWKPFTSRQRVVTRKPGFLWDARVTLFPGIPALVEDSYIYGHGRLVVCGWRSHLAEACNC